VKPYLLLIKDLGQAFLLETNFNRYSAVMTRLGDILHLGRFMIWPVKPFLLLLKSLRQEFLSETNLNRYSTVMTRLEDILEGMCHDLASEALPTIVKELQAKVLP
jgi:hypothetical protein